MQDGEEFSSASVDQFHLEKKREIESQRKKASVKIDGTLTGVRLMSSSRRSLLPRGNAGYLRVAIRKWTYVEIAFAREAAKRSPKSQNLDPQGKDGRKSRAHRRRFDGILQGSH